MDDFLCMISVYRDGRGFVARRYNLVPGGGVQQTDECRKGSLKDVRSWIKENHPGLVMFKKDEHDDKDVYESWW